MAYWFDIQASDAAVNQQRFSQSDGSMAITAFLENRILFNMPRLHELDTIRDMETDYGRGACISL